MNYKIDEEVSLAEVHEKNAYQTKVSFDLEDRAWDEFLDKTPGGHHVQTSMWGHLKTTIGWKVLRILAFRNDEIVGGLQVLLRNVLGSGTIGYVSNGPVLAEESAELVDCLIKELQQVMKSEKIRFIMVQPPDNDALVTPALPKHGFEPSPIMIGVDATVKIDLTADPDEIMGRMKSKTRYNIRLGKRKGVTVRQGTRADLPLFHELLVATSERQEFTPYSLDYFEKMWELFEPNGHLKLFFTEFEGDTLSVNLAIPFNDTVIYKKGAWSGKQGKLRPNEVMHWEVMMWSKENGYKLYDLEGIKVEAAEYALRGEALPDTLKDSTSRFKLGFGGDVLLMAPVQSYVSNSLMRWGFKKAMPSLETMMPKIKALLR